MLDEGIATNRNNPEANSDAESDSNLPSIVTPHEGNTSDIGRKRKRSKIVSPVLANKTNHIAVIYFYKPMQRERERKMIVS